MTREEVLEKIRKVIRGDVADAIMKRLPKK